ncbi:MAG: hypothetical protein GX432_04770 [Candidatus Atribacteria bacterium]|nr:hypothetical protein [Candidatus Atribacteria bacterium]
MDLQFGNKDLENLYTTGKSRRYQRNVVKKFFLRVQSLKAAKNIYDLWNLHSLHFERLSGFSNRFSVRINDQYRLEFEIHFEDENQTQGLIRILEISKHYGD